MDPLRTVQFLGTARAATGLALMLLPGTLGRAWIGPAAREPGGQVMLRAVGARDVALGFGALRAAQRGAPVRGWVEAGMLADTVDALAMLAAFRRLSGPGRFLVLATAAGSAVIHGALAARVAPPAEAPGLDAAETTAGAR
jgi:hypothetical protein